ncbi:hypothetical protein OLH23_05120, partial [Streptococcus pneumoniae]|uniref:hypothetical protein n=1 Tax=Streptococcus pneumoniae TaxID=1313 RepID=UPI001C5FB0F3
LKNAWTTSRQVNFFWVANFNLKFGFVLRLLRKTKNIDIHLTKNYCMLSPLIRNDKGITRKICEYKLFLIYKIYSNNE